jgi:formate hydrogenlyase subunit 3/multisubunit Na+/H+ antiporter MnhD subunit
MDLTPTTLLPLALLGYVLGGTAGLLFLRQEKLANWFSFGCATLAALCGVVACGESLITGATTNAAPIQLLPTLIPYLQFTVHLDALGAFFGLIVSLLGLALSVSSGAKTSAYLARFSTLCFWRPHWCSWPTTLSFSSLLGKSWR